MRVRWFAMTFALSIFFALAIPHPALGEDRGTGHFRLGEHGVKLRHAIAVRKEARGDPGDDQIYVYLSDQALDAAKVAAAFDPDDGVGEQYRDRVGGYVRLCIAADGSECGLYYRRNEHSDSFNSAGYGTLTLDKISSDRIAGRWVLAEPEDFFDKTYDFDLRFDAAIHAPPGDALAAGGGEPGAAYRAYAEAIAKGDIAALRRTLGDSAAWRLPEDDTERVKETLKDLRDEQPMNPTVIRGRRFGDDAVLWVRGVDRDDIAREGRVRMRRDNSVWMVLEQDLDSVD
jgi:hypothetical protein